MEAFCRKVLGLSTKAIPAVAALAVAALLTSFVAILDSNATGCDGFPNMQYWVASWSTTVLLVLALVIPVGAAAYLIKEWTFALLIAYCLFMFYGMLLPWGLQDISLVRYPLLPNQDIVFALTAAFVFFFYRLIRRYTKEERDREETNWSIDWKGIWGVIKILIVVVSLLVIAFCRPP